MLKVNRLQPSRLFNGLGEDLINDRKPSKPLGKIGKGKVLSSYKSQIGLSKQKLEDLIPGIDLHTSKDKESKRVVEGRSVDQTESRNSIGLARSNPL